jgi:hypothetical protein
MFVSLIYRGTGDDSTPIGRNRLSFALERKRVFCLGFTQINWQRLRGFDRSKNSRFLPKTGKQPVLTKRMVKKGGARDCNGAAGARPWRRSAQDLVFGAQERLTGIDSESERTDVNACEEIETKGFSMKTRRLLMASLAGMLATVLSAQELPARKSRASQTFMRRKMEYSQKVFEGIVLERYDVVAKNAAELTRVIETNSFLFSRDQYYLGSSAQFRTDATDLFEAAVATNGPQVLAAYEKVTADCVACHQQFHRAHVTRKHD